MDPEQDAHHRLQREDEHRAREHTAHDPSAAGQPELCPDRADRAYRSHGCHRQSDGSGAQLRQQGHGQRVGERDERSLGHALVAQGGTRAEDPLVTERDRYEQQPDQRSGDRRTRRKVAAEASHRSLSRFPGQARTMARAANLAGDVACKRAPSAALRHPQVRSSKLAFAGGGASHERPAVGFEVPVQRESVG